jgi:putative ABC transport system ATP-binding protein
MRPMSASRVIWMAWRSSGRVSVIDTGTMATPMACASGLRGSWPTWRVGRPSVNSMYSTSRTVVMVLTSYAEIGVRQNQPRERRGPRRRVATLATMDAVVQFGNVTKRYEGAPVAAIDEVSLRIDAGEAVAIMGPSGSGKSTLLNLIAGMDRPTGGAVLVGDDRVDQLSEAAAARFRRRQVGMIFQFFNLLDDMTVIDNVLLPAQLAGAKARQARLRADELIDTLHIGHRRDAYPARLSGGERQRVAIARALINKPSLLLADEPTGAVDTATGEEIGRLLLDLNARGQTLILVTHSPELAHRYARRVIHLADGRIVSDTPAANGPVVNRTGTRS